MRARAGDVGRGGGQRNARGPEHKHTAAPTAAAPPPPPRSEPPSSPEGGSSGASTGRGPLSADEAASALGEVLVDPGLRERAVALAQERAQVDGLVARGLDVEQRPPALAL